MQKNREFDLMVKFILLFFFIFYASSPAKAELVHGKFFNGVKYNGEYFIIDKINADGMRVNPLTIKLKIEGDENLLQYTYIADDFPSVRASDLGFLSVIVNSGGMEGSVTYNYVIPNHGILMSIGTVRTNLHLGKIESIDVQSNKNISKDAINLFVRQVVISNPAALSYPSNSYSAATLLLLGQGEYLTREDRSKLSVLLRSKEISDDPVLLQAVKGAIGSNAQVVSNTQTITRKSVISNRAYFFNSPMSSSAEKSYLIKGDVVILVKKSDDGRYWLTDYVSPRGGKIEKWLRCEDVDYCR